ncbi:adhesion G-protein coupled receptor G7-like [Etheostoma cragini]|uniref:adhesion G-protein coupled receptor G7-like n=1 Tax=Etheostoma cragini TaxID=417921 RepID=UPI00155DE4B6|nr:adhesion G-protein coupled receptor G7-like [Etheostoma cragini]
MFWGFLLPLGLIQVYNVVLLVLVSRTDTAFKRIRKFLNSFSLAVLLGLSWSLGYLVLVTTGTAHLALSYLFCISTTTQGLLIFVLFTAIKPSFRGRVARSLRTIPSVNIQLKQFKYNLQRDLPSSNESYRARRD